MASDSEGKGDFSCRELEKIAQKQKKLEKTANKSSVINKKKDKKKAKTYYTDAPLTGFLFILQNFVVVSKTWEQLSKYHHNRVYITCASII